MNIPFLDSPLKTETQGVYADHCVPGTWGSEIEDGVQSRLHYLEGYRTTVNYIKKAQNHSVDSYSAFADNQYHHSTTMNSELAMHGIETIIMTGLVTNACVRGTSIDGIKLGYEVVLIEDATEAVSADAKAAAIKELKDWGMLSGKMMHDTIADFEQASRFSTSPIGKLLIRRVLERDRCASCKRVCMLREEAINVTHFAHNHSAAFC